MQPKPSEVPSEELRSRPWWIGLDTWIQKDGNYTDFVVGERRQFALMFGYAPARRLVPKPSASSPRCRYTGRHVEYEVTGPLLRSNPQDTEDAAFVLDFGLRAYKEWMVLDDLEPPAAGEWLTGEISLSVDGFPYMDFLANVPGMPPLIYTWTIDEIQLDTSPTIRIEFGHDLYGAGPDDGPMLVPDPSRESWQTVPQTQTWENRAYRLRCTLENAEPTNSMAATGPRTPYGPLRAP